MDGAERVALVNRMMGLVNQLYLLETCSPQLSCEPKTSPQNSFAQANYPRALSCVSCEPKTSPQNSFAQANYPRALSCVSCTPQKQNYPQHISHNCGITQPKTTTTNTYKPNARTSCTSACTPREQKPCFMLKCKPHKCVTNPNDEPLITWTPVLEIRKTSNPKNLERQNDNPITQFVYVEPPGCPYKPVWSTKDPMCEKHCGPPTKCPALGPPPGYDGGPIELCCPGGKGPPVDRWGQSYECKQTLDGRAICKPTKEEGPTDWCDAKTSPFRKCDTMEESKRILTRKKVLNQRFRPDVGIDRDNSKRTSSLYKRPVWPKMETCDDGRCRFPNSPNRNKRSRGTSMCCSEI